VADSFLAYCDESGQRDYGPKTDKYFVVAGAGWGTVALSAFTVSSESNQYHRGFMRFDGAVQTAALRGFLNEVLPHGAHYLGPVSVPPTS